MRKVLKLSIILILSILLTSCMNKTTTITTTLKEDYSNVFKGINDLNPNSKAYEIKYFEIEENEMGYIRSILNPYQSKDIRITSNITTPSNKLINKDAYYKLDYEIKYNDILQTKDTAKYLNIEHFLISYKPKEVGLHKIDVNVYIKEELTQTFSYEFNVSSNDTDYKGTIKVASNNKSFVFENGETYIPVGENIGWYTSSSLKSFEYDEYFNELKNVNANYVRIWLRYNNFALHMGSANAKIDDFTVRMAELERLDRVLKVAEDSGIYICMTLLNHGQFSKIVNPEWNKNPYSEVLDYPFQFFSRSEIKDIYKEELRYIIARYTEYDSIFTYELFNEVDWTDAYEKSRGKTWAKEMSEYIKSIDPYDRLITTSFMNNSGNSNGIFNLDSIDYYTIHTYSYKSSSGITSRIKNEALTAFNNVNKPVLFEEWGVDSESGSNTYEVDPEGIMLYQALYGSIFSSSGSVMTWWWDTYIKKYNLYHVFKGPFTISKLLDLSGDYSYISKSDITPSDTNLDVLGLKTSDNIYLYIYDSTYTKSSESKQSFTNITLDYDLKDYTPKFYNAYTGDEITNNLDSLSFENDIVIVLNKNK